MSILAKIENIITYSSLTLVGSVVTFLATFWYDLTYQVVLKWAYSAIPALAYLSGFVEWMFLLGLVFTLAATVAMGVVAIKNSSKFKWERK